MNCLPAIPGYESQSLMDRDPDLYTMGTRQQLALGAARLAEDRLTAAYRVFEIFERTYFLEALFGTADVAALRSGYLEEVHALALVEADFRATLEEYVRPLFVQEIKGAIEAPDWVCGWRDDVVSAGGRGRPVW